MFDVNNRYYAIETTTLTLADGREVAYVKRRFIPPPDPTAIVAARHPVVPFDRLDNITARYLGDPTLFWQICDTNLVLHPDELTDEVGETIIITTPSFVR